MRILFPISHGFAARTVLHSELIPELRALGAEVFVVSPNGDETHFEALCKSQGASPHALDLQASKVFSVLGNYRRYVFEDVMGNAALRAKHLREKKEAAHPLLRGAATLGGHANFVLKKLPGLRRRLSESEWHLYRSSKIRSLLLSLRPDLVVSTYPVAIYEAQFLAEAKRLKIMSVGQILSWDNISCKGRWPVLPEAFVTWGPLMSAELKEYYDVPPSAIAECGVAHFDHHRDVDFEHWLPIVMAELKLDVTKPFIFFGMSAGYFAPHEIDVVEWLAEQIRDNVFGDELQLVVRPHPQIMRGNMTEASVLPRLEALQGGRVAVDFPQMMSDRLAWDIHHDDLSRLAAMLHGAELTLNSGSTLSIDALFHQKPVLLPIFDAGHQLEWSMSVRRVVEYPHLKKLLNFGGIEVCGDFKSTQSALSHYLQDPDYRIESRRRALQAEVSVAKKSASKRIADALVGFSVRQGLGKF